MEFHQLRYFVAVAETGNFTRAAERCHVSQPSLSQQILNLESELDQKLFHRLGRRVSLTDAGTFLLERARHLLTELENTRQVLRESEQADIPRRLSIGAIPTVAPYLLPPLLDRARTLFPSFEITVREAFFGELVTAVREGELDFALTSLPVEEPRLLRQSLFTEPLLLVHGQSHHLAAKKEVTLRELANEPLYLLGDSSSLTLQIQRFFGDEALSPRVCGRCAQVATLKTLVALGRGVAILPQITHSLEDRKSLVYRPLAGRSPTREISLLRHRDRYQNKAARQLTDLLLELLAARPTDPISTANL